MLLINGIAGVSILAMAYLFYLIKKETTSKKYIIPTQLWNKQNDWFEYNEKCIFYIAFIFAVVLRIVLAAKFSGHADINCFKYWGNILAKNGFSHFYSSEGLTDYLPGYLYILRIIGTGVNLFNLDYNKALVTFLFKLPAIICDIAIAIVIYNFSKKRFTINISRIICVGFLFNPMVILNSSVWGQIDSLLVLIVVLMSIFIYENKLFFAYFCFGIGFLVKPQMALFAPALFFAFIEKSFVKINEDGTTSYHYNSDEFMKNCAYIVINIAITLVLCVPFGLLNVVRQCFDTVGSYEYASVNAYNIWAMLGLDWAPQDEYFMFLTYRQWSTLFFILLVLISFFIWINNFKERSRYIIIEAMLGIGIFTLMVRMHERYIYPAIILLLLAFIITKKSKLYWLYTLFSAISFINCAHVLFYYDAYNFDGRAAAIIIVGLLQCIAFSYFMLYVVKNYIIHTYKFNKISDLLIPSPCKNNKNISFEVSDSKIDFGLKDVIILAIITLIYGVIAFYNLGDKSVPDSNYKLDNYYDSISLEFDDVHYIQSMEFYLGNYEERNFAVFISENADDWYELEPLMMDSVFCWGSYDIDYNLKYIKLELQDDKAVINELVFKDSDGNIILPVNIKNDKYDNLFDEQELYKDGENFMNSTIFDEIYHARTGYEFNNGLYTYEWTHPPLGKVFISIGMKIFGTNPFGWRFCGTLFGIIMLPFMYLFGKIMTKSTFFASFSCTLMAVDFMHFSQTRIATIDVFVTFFVILMYVFMLWYYKMSFYDKSLLKTFIPLGLCGISFGLGCASKWTGVYAGAGLCVIFFYTMYKRYMEYKYAKKDLDGVTNGIKNQYVADVFIKKFVYTIVYCVLVFVIIPMIIYTLSYIPFVGSLDAPKGLIGRMLTNQTDMFNYHKDCIFEHPYSSRWYEWPLMIKPILYYSNELPDGKLSRISSFGNPIIWWFGIISFLFMLYLIKKYKDKTALFLVIGYLAQMLPWTLVVRTTFIYHYFTSVPFVIMMNTYLFYFSYKKAKKNLMYSIFYLIIAVILFIMFYPALSGYPMSVNYDGKILRWLCSWYV